MSCLIHIKPLQSETVSLKSAVLNCGHICLKILCGKLVKGIFNVQKSFEKQHELYLYVIT